ncbi:MAG: hypothetical protein EDM05_040335 [Leptolyngbya sp. IPPAS B-1204]|nr:hypothetical protein [Elainella sp. C42_A2020_010]RNJ66914.1 MAG: hypothetical protein EDM05_23145 [Leptolyngbya sp. IPPAS B-1204]
MNALQPQHDPSPSPNPSRRHRVRRQPRRLPQRSPHHTLAVETTVKLGVNLLLATTAIITLARLIPYNTQQQADLVRLEAEVKEASTKVAGLQEDFDRHFDPQQAVTVMQEQNIRFNPKQRQVVWLTPETQKPEAEEKAKPSPDTSQPADSAIAPD